MYNRISTIDYQTDNITFMATIDNSLLNITEILLNSLILPPSIYSLVYLIRPHARQSIFISNLTRKANLLID